LKTVTVTEAAVVVLPAASRATAVSVCDALVAVVVFQAIEYGVVVSSAPRFAPSSLNWTPTTPTLSDAFALIVVVLVAHRTGTGYASAPQAVFFSSCTTLPTASFASPNNIAVFGSR